MREACTGAGPPGPPAKLRPAAPAGTWQSDDPPGDRVRRRAGRLLRAASRVPRGYGQFVVKLFGKLTIVAPLVVAPISTIWPFGRTALLIGPMIGSRTGTAETRW